VILGFFFAIYAADRAEEWGRRYRLDQLRVRDESPLRAYLAEQHDEEGEEGR
jgi:hypothetical protein